MAKTAEEIIKIVEAIKDTEKELDRVTKSVSRARKCIENFKDTGNEHLAVTFNHGDGWDSPYFEFLKKYPSDKVRDAVIADLEPAIKELEVVRDDLAIKLEEMKKSLVE